MRYLNFLLLCFLPLFLSSQNTDLRWARSMGSSTVDEGRAVAVDASGNVFTTGGYQGTVDFDPGPSTSSRTSNGSRDIFIQKLDSSGNFLWATSTGGSSGEQGRAIETDAAGSVYITGYYKFTIDFDPGPSTFNLTHIGPEPDIFIQKLDRNGNFAWAKSIGGNASFSDQGWSVNADDFGNIYVTGLYSDTVDFDPGPGVFNLVANSTPALFVLKLDTAGNFIWAKSWDNADGYSIKNDASGNVYVTGGFGNTADFDPGPGVYNITANGLGDVFVLKLDSAGNFIWARGMGGTLSDYSTSLALDPQRNVYISGYYFGTSDFDPGPGVYNLTSNGGLDFYVVKLDANGNFAWATSTGGTGWDFASAHTVDASGNVFVTGNFLGLVDFDPGPATFNLSASSSDIYIQKLDPNGNFVWAGKMGGSGANYGKGITHDALGNIYVTGYFSGSMDADLNPAGLSLIGSAGNSDIFVQKFREDSCTNLAIQFDSVANVSCFGLGYARAHAINGPAPYTYSWNTSPVLNDSVIRFDTAGMYTLSVIDSNSCSTSATLLINDPSTTSAFDLNVNLTSTDFRTGFPAVIWLDAYNDGCVSAGGQLSLVLDPLLTYDSASITPDLINGDTLIWNFTNLVYESTHLQPEIYLSTRLLAGIGDTACLQTKVTPLTGDANPANNVKDYCIRIINSYDPNDKKVYPAGECLENYTLKNEPLTYTIRFQNTGNADAINVHILDTISPYLDITTANVVGSSHTMYTEVLNGNVLDFKFDNIHLPDSTSNEPESHGFVIFEIHPAAGVPNQTEINNKSEIFFDFNDAIVTNTVFNTLTDTLPTCVCPPNYSIDTITTCNSVVWVDGNTYSSSNTTAQHIFLAGSQNGCDSIVTLNLTVTPLDLDLSFINSTFTVDEMGASYQWLDCNSNFDIIPGETGRTFTIIDNSSYAVEVTKNGCSDTSRCFRTASGIQDNKIIGDLLIFPNPVRDALHLSYQGVIDKISIVDVTGKTIRQISRPRNLINVSEFPAGVYFVKIDTEQDVIMKKFVKIE